MGVQQPEPQRTRRWRYIVDWTPQLSVVAEVVGVLIGVCVAFAVITFLLVLDRNDATAKLQPEEVWGFLLQVTLVFMAISSVVFILLSITISHRFLGPALVIKRAVQAMIDGWYDRRFKLRRRDYLKPLAAKVEELADTLAAREDEQALMIESIHECLDSGELDGARVLLERMQDKTVRSKRSEPVEVSEQVAESV